MFQDFGLSFENVSPQIDETKKEGEDIFAFGARLAKEKAEKITPKFSNALVIGADTSVLCQGKIMGKPTNQKEAKEFFSLFLGHPQKVYSFVTVIDLPDKKYFQFHHCTEIQLYPYPQEIMHHPSVLKNSEQYSGGFSIEKEAGFLVQSIQGSYNNVIGFPMEEFLFQSWKNQWLKPVV